MDPRADWAVDGKTSVGKQVTRGKKKTVEIPTEDARPGAGHTEAPTRWCLGEKAT